MRRKETLSFRVEPETAERLRNAAYWCREPAGLIAEQAINAFVDLLEARENQGEAFQPRRGVLRSPGRPAADRSQEGEKD